MESRSYALYIIDCTGERLYTGITTDLERRMKEHQSGSRKAKFTRAFKINKLAVYWRLYCSLSQILRLEKYIKKMSRADKLKLIARPETIKKILDELQMQHKS